MKSEKGTEECGVADMNDRAELKMIPGLEEQESWDF